MSWHDIFFAEGKNLDVIEIAIRTAIIFLVTLFAIRIAKKRFLGKASAFDVVLGVIVGSVVSRAINGSAALFQTIVAAFVLIGMHWIISAFVSRSDKFANLIEGTSTLLVKDGTINNKALREHHFRKPDISEAARLQANINSISQIKEAHLEANGKISIVKE